MAVILGTPSENSTVLHHRLVRIRSPQVPGAFRDGVEVCGQPEGFALILPIKDRGKVYADAFWDAFILNIVPGYFASYILQPLLDEERALILTFTAKIRVDRFDLQHL